MWSRFLLKKATSKPDSKLDRKPEDVDSAFKVPQQTDEEVIRQLPQDFYQEKFDPVIFIFEQLPKEENVVSSAEIGSSAQSLVEFDDKFYEKQLALKERALDAILSKLSNQVMDNYNAFVQGMTQIHDLGIELENAAFICRDSRKKLSNAREELVQRVFKILAKSRKLSIYRKMMEYLLSIANVIQLQNEVKNSIEIKDYPSAIQYCLQCKTMISRNKQFSCMEDLSSSLQVQYNTIQEKLDSSLIELCRSFNSLNFERIIVAYRLIGQSHRVLDKLLRSFLEILNSTSRNVLTSHVFMSEQSTQKMESLKKMRFRDLTSYLSGEHYMMCLTTVLEMFCDIMFCHFSMDEWFGDKLAESSIEHDENMKYFADLKEGLAKFKKTIWDDMQSRVSSILNLPVISSFKIDDFLKVLDSIEKFIEMGEEFTQLEAQSLRSSMKTISRTYFESMHKSRMEDLLLMLENETWQLVPVQGTFSFKDLKESRSLLLEEGIGSKTKSSSTTSTVSVTTTTANEGNISSSKVSSAFNAMKQYGNPFSNRTSNPFMKIQENMKSSDEKEEDEEDDNEVPKYVRTGKIEDPKHLTFVSTSPINAEKKSLEEVSLEGAPLVTNTIINVVRFIAKYAFTMKILQSISYEVFLGITQVVDYYISSIYVFFSDSSIDDEPLSSVSAKLRSVLAKLKRLFGTTTKFNFPASVSATISEFGNNTNNSATSTGNNNTSSNANLSSTESVENIIKKVRLPKLTSIIINEPQNLYGFCHRTIGIESLLFLEEAMTAIKPHITAFIPKLREKTVTDFYNTVEVIPELVRYLYKRLAMKQIQWDEFITMVINTKWDIKEVGINQSPYVDWVLKELTNFGKKLNREATSYGISQKQRDIVWEELVKYTMEQLVEGYSRVKKCTNEGRTVMLLDLKIFQNALENLIALRPIPNASFVESYLKVCHSRCTFVFAVLLFVKRI